MSTALELLEKDRNLLGDDAETEEPESTADSSADTSDTSDTSNDPETAEEESVVNEPEQTEQPQVEQPTVQQPQVQQQHPTTYADLNAQGLDILNPPAAQAPQVEQPKTDGTDLGDFAEPKISEQAETNSYRPNTSGEPRVINGVVVHSSDGHRNGDINTLTTGGVSSHYYVERDGTVHHFVGDNDVAWHAGDTSGSGGYLTNGNTLGIEQEHIDGKEDWPEAQLEGTARVIAGILKRNPQLTFDNVVGHSDVAPERKADPVDYPWDKVKGLVEKALGGQLPTRTTAGVVQPEKQAPTNYADLNAQGLDILNPPATAVAPDVSTPRARPAGLQDNGFYQNEDPKNFITGTITTFAGEDDKKKWIEAKSAGASDAEANAVGDSGVGAPRLGQLDNSKALGIALPKEYVESVLGSNSAAWRTARVILINRSTGERYLVPITDFGPSVDQQNKGIAADLTEPLAKLFKGTDGNFSLQIVPNAGADILKDPAAFAKEQVALSNKVDLGATQPEHQTFPTAAGTTVSKEDQAKVDADVQADLDKQNKTLQGLFEDPKGVNSNLPGMIRKLESDQIEGVSPQFQQEWLEQLKQNATKAAQDYYGIKDPTEAYNKLMSNVGPVEFTGEIFSKMIPNIQSAITAWNRGQQDVDQNRFSSFASMIGGGNVTPERLLQFKNYLAGLTPNQRSDALEEMYRQYQHQFGLEGTQTAATGPTDIHELVNSVNRLLEPKWQADQKAGIELQEKQNAKNLQTDPRLQGTTAGFITDQLGALPKNAIEAMTGMIGQSVMLSELYAASKDRLKSENPNMSDDEIRAKAAVSTLYQMGGAELVLRATGGKLGGITGGISNIAKRVVASTVVHGTTAGVGGAIQQAAGNLAEGRPLLAGIPEAFWGGVIQGVPGGFFGGFAGRARAEEENVPRGTKTEVVPPPKTEVTPPSVEPPKVEPVTPPAKDVEPVIQPPEADVEPNQDDVEKNLNRQTEDLDKKNRAELDLTQKKTEVTPPPETKPDQQPGGDYGQAPPTDVEPTQTDATKAQNWLSDYLQKNWPVKRTPAEASKMAADLLSGHPDDPHAGVAQFVLDHPQAADHKGLQQLLGQDNPRDVLDWAHQKLGVTDEGIVGQTRAREYIKDAIKKETGMSDAEAEAAADQHVSQFPTIHDALAGLIFGSRQHLEDDPRLQKILAKQDSTGVLDWMNQKRRDMQLKADQDAQLKQQQQNIRADPMGQVQSVLGKKSRFTDTVRRAFKPYSDAVTHALTTFGQSSRQYHDAVEKLRDKVVGRFDDILNGNNVARDFVNDPSRKNSFAAFIDPTTGQLGLISNLHYIKSNLAALLDPSVRRGNDPAEVLHRVMQEELIHLAQMRQSWDEYSKSPERQAMGFYEYERNQHAKTIRQLLGMRDKFLASASERTRAAGQRIDQFLKNSFPFYHGTMHELTEDDLQQWARSPSRNMLYEGVRQLLQSVEPGGPSERHWFAELADSVREYYQRALSGLQDMYRRLSGSGPVGKSILADTIRKVQGSLKEMEAIGRKFRGEPEPTEPATGEGEAIGTHDQELIGSRIGDEMSKLKRWYGAVFKSGESAMLDYDETKPLALSIRRKPSFLQAFAQRAEINKLADVFNKIAPKDRQRVSDEYAAYNKAEQLKQPLPAVSADTQRLIQAGKVTLRNQGLIAKELNMHVRDSQGRVRPMKLIGDEYYPRMISADTRDIFARRDGARRQEFDDLVDRQIKRGVVKDRQEFIDKFITSTNVDPVSNDHFSNLEKARELHLPLDFYDFGPEALLRYADRANNRLAQVAAFGQKLSAGGKDLFDHSVQKIMNRGDLSPGAKQTIITRINQQRRVEYNEQYRDNFEAPMRGLRQIATGAWVGNPLSAWKYLATGQAQNLIYGTTPAFAKAFAHLADTGRAMAAIKEARDRNLWRANLADILHDYATVSNQSWATKGIQGFTHQMLKWGGHNVADALNRTFAMQQAKFILEDFAKDYRMGRDNARTRYIEDMIRRKGVTDLDALSKENGNGPLTDEFIRQYVMDVHGNYGPSQSSAGLFSNPIWKNLLQFQRWGINSWRIATREFIMPLAKSVADRNPEDFAFHLMRNAGFLAGAAGTGLSIAMVRNMLTGKHPDDATVQEIWDRFSHGDAKEALVQALERGWSSIILSGFLGSAGDYSEAIKLRTGASPAGRSRDPLTAPALGMIAPFVNLAQGWAGESNFMHPPSARILDQFAGDLFSQYRVGRDIGLNAVNVSGLKTPLGEWYAGKNDESFLRSRVRMFEDENPVYRQKRANINAKKMEISGRGQFDPYRDDIQTSLLTGNDQKLADTVRNWLDQFPKEEQKAQLKRVKTSIVDSAPIKPGGSVRAEAVEDFLNWAKENLPQGEFNKIVGLEQTYMSSALRNKLIGTSPSLQKVMRISTKVAGAQ